MHPTKKYKNDAIDDSSVIRGVRKGSWTDEEDHLLRKCIQKFGEGSWHRVPQRAGLNRCRKSCRLRWVNYLKPNIKRGQFKEDEVDLIIRLHKLLGNRWSLIAGRLPGRTANDVKNYWNTHLLKKFSSTNKNNPTTNNNKTTQIIKPQARTFLKTSSWPTRKVPTGPGPGPGPGPNEKPLMCSLEDEEEEEDSSDAKWWESILFDVGQEDHDVQHSSGPGPALHEEPTNSKVIELWPTTLYDIANSPFGEGQNLWEDDLFWDFDHVNLTE